jgi:hypothetical protein
MDRELSSDLLGSDLDSVYFENISTITLKQGKRNVIKLAAFTSDVMIEFPDNPVINVTTRITFEDKPKDIKVTLLNLKKYEGKATAYATLDVDVVDLVFVYKEDYGWDLVYSKNRDDEEVEFKETIESTEAKYEVVVKHSGETLELNRMNHVHLARGRNTFEMPVNPVKGQIVLVLDHGLTCSENSYLYLKPSDWPIESSNEPLYGTRPNIGFKLVFSGTPSGWVFGG